MDTSRVDGVKAPQHRGTPRSHVAHFEIFDGLRGRHLDLQLLEHDLELFEVYFTRSISIEALKHFFRGHLRPVDAVVVVVLLFLLLGLASRARRLRVDGLVVGGSWGAADHPITVLPGEERAGPAHGFFIVVVVGAHAPPARPPHGL